MSKTFSLSVRRNSNSNSGNSNTKSLLWYFPMIDYTLSMCNNRLSTSIWKYRISNADIICNISQNFMWERLWQSIWSITGLEFNLGIVLQFHFIFHITKNLTVSPAVILLWGTMWRNHFTREKNQGPWRKGVTWGFKTSIMQIISSWNQNKQYIIKQAFPTDLIGFILVHFKFNKKDWAWIK